MGVRVSVLSKQSPELAGVWVFSGAVPPLRPWRPFRWIRRWRDNFREVMKAARPDLIHVHFPDAYSVPLEDIGEVPLVVSTWGAEIIRMTPESETDRLRKVALLRRADRVLASSQCLADATASYAGLAPGRVTRLYWGVDLDQFTPHPRPAEGSVIGFAKALFPKYGAGYLIEALPRVLARVPEARVMMLGKGPKEPGLRDRADRLGVADAITWHGSVEYGQMPAHFARMSLSVVPSVHQSETLAVAALESQAMQVPVVASRIGGLTESVLDGRTGLLVPPRDPSALAEAIIRLLGDANLRTALGQQGRRHIEEHFDWRRSLEQTVDVYSELLEGRHNPMVFSRSSDGLHDFAAVRS
jgi:glycosyltransferase involved in cell wall biosynthesis